MIDREKLESEYFRSYSDLRPYSSSFNEPEITFALHSPGGGVRGEISMKWISLMDREVPQLQVFNDAWEILACFTDLIEVLAKHDKTYRKNNPLTPDEFIDILKSLGFIDTRSYNGDFIPQDMFESYQLSRKRNNKLKQIL